ncbi:hypothetical protein Tco_1115207 [Tanacetum coccineum]
MEMIETIPSLLNMSQAKAVSREKEKGVELKDVEETDRPRPTSTRSLLTLKPLLKIDPKDKGKKKIEEEDESEKDARKMQEEWESEEVRNRIAKEKATNEALIRNFDDIKARIEADRLLLKHKNKKEAIYFTIKKLQKFLSWTQFCQRKFLAQQRSEAIRNRPPTKNQMMTYLKHVGNFKHSELKTKKRRVKMNQGEKKKESTRKRKLGTRKKMKSRKRRYIQNTSEDDSEKENDELRLHLTIAPDEEKEVDNFGEDLMVMSKIQDDEDKFGTPQQDWNIFKKKYPLRKKVLVQMLELKLESEEDSTMALELIRFIKKLLAELESEDFDGNEEDL